MFSRKGITYNQRGSMRLEMVPVQGDVASESGSRAGKKLIRNGGKSGIIGWGRIQPY